MFEGDLQQFVAKPVVETDVQRAIRSAKEMIQTRGRARGELQDTTGAICILGALGYFVNEKRDFAPPCAVAARAARHIAKAIGRGGEAAPTSACFIFNDSPSTTDEALFAVLDRAYELAASS